MKKNAPYVKVYDENGVLTNPITANAPYLFAPHVGFLKMYNRASGSKRKVWEIVRNKFFKGMTAVKV
jgi:hypothetical protein